MILHGDELGRTQRGNNNVYCQDNELSWMRWDLDDWQKALLAFAQPRRARCAAEHPVFRRRRFFAGVRTTRRATVGDIAWFTPTGSTKRGLGQRLRRR